VKECYPRLSHRYYKLKAKWMGVKKMDYWDRNAPLPFSAEKKIPWDAGKKSVLDAYRAFHPVLADTAERFFNEGWIDARPRAGKDSGAFSAPTVPEVHPYILMSYKDEIGDVMTLAHELGHGIHQVLAGPQGYLMSDTPLTLAETASVFGEMLTFQSFLKKEKDPKTRKAVIAKKVEDMLNTVVRQIAFHSFETAVHNERKNGELTPERIGEIWMQVMKESLGPAFRFDDGYKYFWAYISHFYHVPFYVYAYAFGDCLVNALYAVYENAEQGFAAKYLELLKAGGTKRHDELLKPFGLDARDPKFWKKGLSVIENLIDQLE
jgi:oligoendopeptidase F